MSSMHAKFLEWVARLGQWKATTDALDQVKWPRLNDNFRIIISDNFRNKTSVIHFLCFKQYSTSLYFSN